MVFYLQDASSSAFLAECDTLDSVVVRMRREGSQAKIELPPPIGRVQFGDLRRLKPISREWGFDRGLPIDRYYIEAFLTRHREDIKGRVLEFGDDSYTKKFGGNVVEVDILNVREGIPGTTIVGDIADAPQIPSDRFDCVVFTQTLQLIYDVKSAIRTLYRILKPGGVLLATFPGISQIYDPDWGDSWYWNFTALSSRKLFEEVLATANLGIGLHGNVLTATGFLQGLATEELSVE
jgi:SAM-dependent methyltransferase